MHNSITFYWIKINEIKVKIQFITDESSVEFLIPKIDIFLKNSNEN